MIFTKRRRGIIGQCLRHLGTPQISKVLAVEWRQLSPTERKYWDGVYDVYIKKYTEKFQGYRYKRAPKGVGKHSKVKKGEGDGEKKQVGKCPRGGGGGGGGGGESSKARSKPYDRPI